jgi:hypothetical protein
LNGQHTENVVEFMEDSEDDYQLMALNVTPSASESRRVNFMPDSTKSNEQPAIQSQLSLLLVENQDGSRSVA